MVLDPDIRQDILLYALEKNISESELNVEELKKTFSKKYFDFTKINFGEFDRRTEGSFVNDVLLKDSSENEIHVEKKQRRLKNAMTYDECKAWCKANNITSFSKYLKCVKPLNVPTNPHHFYKGKGWISFVSFFDSKHVPTKRDIWDYQTCRRWVFDNLRQHNINSWRKFQKWRAGKIPNTPICPVQFVRNPDDVFKGKGWKSWQDFLFSLNNDFGYSTDKPIKQPKPKRQYLSFEEARKWVISNIPEHLQTKRGFNFLSKKKLLPTIIPSHPEVKYSDWISWQHFFGKKVLKQCNAIAKPGKHLRILKHDKKIFCKVIEYTGKRFRAEVETIGIHGYPIGSIVNFNRKDIVQ